MGKISGYRLIEPGSNSVLPYQKAFILLYIAPVHSANEYMAIDRGEYLCTKCLRAFITSRLDASQPVDRYHVSRDNRWRIDTL